MIYHPDCTLLPTPALSLRWKYDTESICYQGKHGVLTWVLGIPGLVLIALLMPLVTAALLARNRRK